MENTATSRYAQKMTGAKECHTISAGDQRRIIRLLHEKLGNKLF